MEVPFDLNGTLQAEEQLGKFMIDQRYRRGRWSKKSSRVTFLECLWAYREVALQRKGGQEDRDICVSR